MLPLQKAQSTGVMGWCVAENGERERGFAMLSEAIAGLKAIQSKTFMSYLLGLLADARCKAGRYEEAMTAVEEAIALVDGGSEQFYAAELYRLRGVHVCASVSCARTRRGSVTAQGYRHRAETGRAHARAQGIYKPAGLGQLTFVKASARLLLAQMRSADRVRKCPMLGGLCCKTRSFCRRL